MKDQFILTPYFLDKPVPALEALAQSSWHIIRGQMPDAEAQTAMSGLHQLLAAKVEQVIQSGDRPVSIAGDCCSVIGVAAGMQRAGIDPILIWFDAHGDFNTWKTTPSGFLGGMPLAMIVGRGEQTMPASVGLLALAEEHVILTDARDLDPAEKGELQRSKVTHLPSINDLLSYSLPDGPVLVHFDADVLDPGEAPAMSYPAPGGPNAHELKRVFQYLSSTGKVRAVSMSTWNPDLAKSGKTGDTCMKLLESLLGS